MAQNLRGDNRLHYTAHLRRVRRPLRRDIKQPVSPR